MNTNLAREEVVDVVDNVIPNIHALENTEVSNENILKRQSPYRYIKRFMDVILATIALVVLSPIFLIIAIAIKIESKGPVFFKHTRIGKNGKIIKLYKFRSMVINAEELIKSFTPEQMKEYKENYKLTNDPRITKIGKFIRKTSLDEFPQFLNVLKGDMSLVGTRPPTVDEFEQYEGYHKRRLSMKPGLTGVWQVSGRSDITDFEEIVAMDVDYISNWSLKRDLEIILKTIQVVLHSDGAR